jgi:DNA-binding NtrC family response regulator
MNEIARFNLHGSSSQFRQTCALVAKFASVDATVLLVGETGTGKEMLGRAIHYMSARKDQPFIPVNCAALAEALVESELFGHERGAFTDAKAVLPGLIHEADRGTLFLDEIDSLSPKAQAALLRFLQDGSYRRVGGTGTRHSDARIVVATNADLGQLVEARQFRQDLLYRLNVLTLQIPPLRARAGDAVELAELFLARFNRQYRIAPKRFHPDSLAFIAAQLWPGNVRELENVILREFLLCEGDEIRLGSPAVASPRENLDVSSALSFKDAKTLAVAAFERRYVHDIMQRAQGNLSHAARLAGQERSAFGKLARKHGLSKTINLHSIEDGQ